MSMTAKRIDQRQMIEKKFTAGYDIVSVAGVSGLIARSVAEQKAVMGRGWKMYFQPTYTVSRAGLEALSNKGINAFEDAHPRVLPWNLYKDGPGSNGSYYKDSEVDETEQSRLVEAHARFGGWMKAAASLPLLAKAIGQAVSVRGVNSPRTRVDLWALAARYPSPHRLQRLIGAVQRRAVEILAAYDGRGCTLRSALVALAATGSVGKAAVIAAYRSLTGESPWGGEGAVKNYKTTRSALIALHACSVLDTTDGVAVSRTAEPVYEKLGVRVYPYVQKNAGGWTNGFLVLSGIRSYHVGPGRRGDWEWVWMKGHTQGVSTFAPEGAALAAVQAWRKQAELERKEKFFLDQLRPVGFCPIVYFSDSLAAGNCHSGTEGFMSRAGIPASQQYVPAHMLFPYIAEQRVYNVLTLVAQRVSTLQLTA